MSLTCCVFVLLSLFVLWLLLYLSPSLCFPCPPTTLSSASIIQACNTKYPDYDKTGSICVSEHINNTLTRYRWLISAPAGPDGVTSPMREVDFDTFFTSSKMITLDSVYFQAGSRVQCAARAVNSNGEEGLELSSPIVTISREEGEDGATSFRVFPLLINSAQPWPPVAVTNNGALFPAQCLRIELLNESRLRYGCAAAQQTH